MRQPLCTDLRAPKMLSREDCWCASLRINAMLTVPPLNVQLSNSVLMDLRKSEVARICTIVTEHVQLLRPLSANVCRQGKHRPCSRAPTATASAVQVFAEQRSESGAAEALRLFQEALALQPTADEACAALYNSACCYAKLRQWQPAVDAISAAVNDYDLKLTVAVNVRSRLRQCRRPARPIAVHQADLQSTGNNQAEPHRSPTLSASCTGVEQLT